MSSHYVYVACPTSGCRSQGSIYTGDTELDDFDDAAWEGETIFVACKEHAGSATSRATPEGNKE